MVDSRCMLPQEVAGGHVGLPCVRRRPWHSRDCLPEVVRPPPEPDGFPLPGANCETRPEFISFSGTENMPWVLARARSMGALTTGGVVDKALKARTKTDFDLLVDILVSAVRDHRPLDIRHFRQPYNAHRHANESTYLDLDKRRKKVLQVLRQFPLLDIYDLATVSSEYWTKISRELGGLSHDAAMKHALEHVQQVMSPMDRAAFWAAVGPRQRSCDHFRQMQFAANATKRPVGARYGFKRHAQEVMCTM